MGKNALDDEVDQSFETERDQKELCVSIINYLSLDSYTFSCLWLVSYLI